MSLEEELRQSINMAAKSSPAALRALTEGPQDIDAIGLLANVVLPLLDAHADAIYRLAREIDEMTGEVDS